MIKLFLERQPLEEVCKKNKLGAFKHFKFWQCMDTIRDKKLLEENLKILKNNEKKNIGCGGTGFLGFHLLKKLSHLNYTLFSLSSKKPTKHKKISKVKYIICDVTKPVLLKKN